MLKAGIQIHNLEPAHIRQMHLSQASQIQRAAAFHNHRKVFPAARSKYFEVKHGALH